MKEVDLLNPYIYIPSFLKIRTKSGALDSFKPNKAQMKLLSTILTQQEKQRPVRIIILKARQMGFSTMTEAICFHNTATKKFRKSLIIAHEDSASQNLYNMFKTFYFNLPEPLMPMRKKNNSQELVFENPTVDDIERRRNSGLQSSVKVATAGNKGAGRSDTIHFLHCCLSSDSKIVLSDGSLKEMKDIECGDLVLTSNGNVAPVTFKTNTGEKQTYKLSVWCSGEPIYCTDNHKILTLEGYKELKDLTKKDYVAMPKIKVTNEITSYDFKLSNIERIQHGGTKHIENYSFALDYNFGYFIGYYLAEGHIKKDLGGIIFTYNKDENFIEEALKGCSNLETSRKDLIYEGTNRKRTVLYGKFLASAINSICGRVEDKHIPQWFFKTNEEFLKGVLKGYFDGDGSKTQTNRINAASIHDKISRQIQRIIYALQLGGCSVTKKERYRYEVKTKDVNIMNICGDTFRRYLGEEVINSHKATKYKIVDGQVFCKVKDIKERKIETVYDIEVGHEDHNYQTTSCIVSNSEVAFWQDAKTTVTGLFQTVPYDKDTTVILESTANGVGGFFYETWKKAEKGENGFIPLFFPWFDEPTYSIDFESEEEKVKFIDEVQYTYKDSKGNVVHTEEWDLVNMFPNISYEQLKWRRWCIANNCYGDVEKFHQEYPSYPDEAFISSGRPRFNTSVLKQYRNNVKEPLFNCFLNDTALSIDIEENKSGYVSIWKMPEEGKFYVIGADVAEGLIDGDYSNAYVLDEELDIVARFRGHIDPDLFGDELVKLSKLYNDGYLGIENNNHGLTTIKAVQRKDYFNLFFSKNYDKIADSVTKKVGWSTTPRTKPLMIDKLAEYIRNKWLGMYDLELVNECLTYIIEDNGSTNAQEGCHDDCVMSLAIALQLYLEGKGDTFVPEDEHKAATNNNKKKRVNVLNIQDFYDEDEEGYNIEEVSK